MLKIKFANNTEAECLVPLETEEFYNGHSRRTLTIQCPVDAESLDVLNALLSDEANTASITIEDDAESGTVAVYVGYVLMLKLAVEPVQTAPETSETPAAYENRIIVKLGKRTYIEQQLAALGL